jgi:hypothetical protein
MEFLEKYKDIIMAYIPIGLLILIFVGLIASELSCLNLGKVFLKPYTFGMENRIQILG